MSKPLPSEVEFKIFRIDFTDKPAQWAMRELAEYLLTEVCQESGLTEADHAPGMYRCSCGFKVTYSRGEYYFRAMAPDEPGPTPEELGDER